MKNPDKNQNYWQAQAEAAEAKLARVGEWKELNEGLTYVQWKYLDAILEGEGEHGEWVECCIGIGWPCKREEG